MKNEQDKRSEDQMNRTEIEPINDIIIGRPGGNDTALLKDNGYSPEIRKQINDLVMAKYPNVEQVGFVDFSDENRFKLTMAGGEFCGNATRLTAYICLDGKPGKCQIEVTGVDQILNAGVDENGFAWAQMPLNNKDGKPLMELVDEFSVINLDGISQVITDLPETVNTTDELKQVGQNILTQLGLDKSVPAAGVMFMSTKNEQISSDPVVWVREIETLFYETACGSGTCAVGIVAAISTGESIFDYPVMQPSGLPILVDVDKDSETGNLTDVRIKGPVEIMNKLQVLGMNRYIK